MEIQTITIRLSDIRKDRAVPQVNVFLNGWERLLNLELTAEMLAKPLYVEGASGEFIPDLIDAIEQAMEGV
jgi:hypothetical protein